MLDRAEPTPADAARPRARALVPSRRGFLIGAGGALGLVIGYALWPRSYPGGMAAVDGETLVGPWLRVAPSGQVTLAVPQAEMGQGSWSGLAQIAADELGAAWTQMAVEPAPWHPAFAHVGMVREGTAGLPALFRGIAGHVGTHVVRRLNLHLTGGSTSIRGYHDIVRAAAAEARARLEMAAARAWGVSPARVETANGFLLFQANRMPFGQAAALVDPAREPARARAEPRAVSDRRLDGRTLPRLDIPPKVDGSARFGGDVRLPGMVYAAIRHGPAGSELVDVTAPEGVEVIRGPGWFACVGPTTHEARRALGRCEGQFRLPGRAAGPWIMDAILDAAEATDLKPLTARGDVEGALGDRPIEVRYQAPFLAHACMEPMTATARVADGRAEVWGPTQSLTIAHWQVAEALGLSRDSVLIHPTLVGGGFGRKAEPDAMVEAALIARAAGRPVQLTWTRGEDFRQGRFRPGVAARMRGSLDAQQRIAAWDAVVAAPSVGNSFMGRNLPRLASSRERPRGSDIEGAEAIPYAVGAFRVAHAPVSQPLPLGYWRAVGHSFSAFLVESFMDEMAHAARADPLAFRLQHLAERPRHRAVLEAVAEAGRWGDSVPAGFGRGIALHESFGSIAAMVVEAGVRRGQLVVSEVTTAIDCGRAIAPDSVRSQLEGAAIMGLSAALGEAMAFEGGEAATVNFDTYRLMTLADCPPTITTVLVNSGAALGGVGEPGLPPAAPALANALFQATGTRARSLPLARLFVGG